MKKINNKILIIYKQNKKAFIYYFTAYYLKKKLEYYYFKSYLYKEIKYYLFYFIKIEINYKIYIIIKIY